MTAPRALGRVEAGAALIAPAVREYLRAEARRAVEEVTLGTVALEPDHDFPALDEPGAAFVTLTIGGELRGCLGRLRPDPAVSLLDCVLQMARAAATRDPRFPPVTPAELDHLDLEISVMGPFEEISAQDVDYLVIGAHGLYLEKYGRAGVLLPQVASDHGWIPRQFVEHTCVKAGLGRDEWRDGCRIWRFRAEIF